MVEGEERDNCFVEYVLADTLQEYKDVNIPMDNADYDRLKVSIEKDGIRQPLQVCGKTVLAGNTRLRLARELNIRFVPCLYLPSDMSDMDKKEYAISDNLSRRHLSTAQKAEIALVLLEIEKVRARARQLATLKQNTVPLPGSGTDENAEKSGTFLFQGAVTPPEGEALRIAAGKAGIGYNTALKAKTIRSENPEIYKEVLAGDKTLSEAYRIVKSAPESEKLYNRKLQHAGLDNPDSTVEQLRAATGLLNTITGQAAGLDSAGLVQIGRAVRELKDAADKAYSMLRQTYQAGSAGSSEPEAGWCSGCMLTEQQGRLCEKVRPCPKYSQGQIS